MASDTVHLPNGHRLSVGPVFGGLFFKFSDLSLHNPIFPAGWTIVLHSEDFEEPQPGTHAESTGHSGDSQRHHTHRYRRPTNRHDSLFISSITNPSSNEFKAPVSPTRQIAMMLWITLYWYFQEPEPSLHLHTEAAKHTPEAGRPRADWRIRIKREGIFRGRNLLQKLERMGLIASEDSAVGAGVVEQTHDDCTDMFVSRRAFWQLPATLFLFTLAPVETSTLPGTPFSMSPYGSRPNSPILSIEPQQLRTHTQRIGSPATRGFEAMGPFASGSHLPTYYPPPSPQYVVSSGIVHPVRPKPPRQGETFYTRYIPSIGEYLSFRTASLSTRPVAYLGPVASAKEMVDNSTTTILSRVSLASVEAIGPKPVPPSARSSGGLNGEKDTSAMSDLELLNKWMNDDRVAAFWGCSGSLDVQEDFLRANLKSRHSFPVIGCWDGKPFGYFEIYWVQEDILGRQLKAGEVNEWDRGLHVLVGEQKFRGRHRLQCWLTSLIHWAFTSDYRTSSVCLEPRVDNTRFIQHLSDLGFGKEREVSFPHKQSALMRYKRGTFDGPSI